MVSSVEEKCSSVKLESADWSELPKGISGWKGRGNGGECDSNAAQQTQLFHTGLVAWLNDVVCQRYSDPI